MTIAEKKTYDFLKERVKYASSVVSRTKNEETDKAFDKAVNELMDFEKEFGINGWINSSIVEMEENIMFELKKNAVNRVTMKWYMDNLKDKIIMTEKETQLLPNYTEQDLEKVISNIMSNLSINSIAITDKNELVDGYKRISAINSFINGDIEYNGKVYSELSSEEKELFDNCHIGIFVG